MAKSLGLHKMHSRAQWDLAKCQALLDSAEAFWAKADRRGADECWLWGGQADGSFGYGRFPVRVNGEKWKASAHRIAWFLSSGSQADDLCVCHRCDVPLCINPAHLFLGTDADNLNDARQKGRLIQGSGARKLSDDAYREIRATPYSVLSRKALAAKFNVQPASISAIRRGRQGLSTFHGIRSAERVAVVCLPVRGAVSFHAGNSNPAQSSTGNSVSE